MYVHFPVRTSEPPSVLRGFTDVELQPGVSQRVTITLSRDGLSIWDVVSQSWIRPSGTFSLSVGASSRNFRLKDTIRLSSIGPFYYCFSLLLTFLGFEYRNSVLLPDTCYPIPPLFLILKKGQ
jgi:Fibronectin type III-like domain